MANEIAVRSGQTAISTLSAARVDLAEVLALAIVPDDRDKAVQRTLVVLAEIRQAHISAETLLIFGRALRAYESVDLRATLEHYRRVGRAEGETAMPDLPSLESVVKACRGERLRAATAAKQAAEEAAVREKYEREKAAGLHDPDDATRETMNRLNRILEDKKGATMSLTGALAGGDAAREENTRRRASQVISPAPVAQDACRKCSVWADMSPAELRKLADMREARQAAA